MSLLNWFMKAASQTPLFVLRLYYFNVVWEGQILEASGFLGFLACLYFAEVLRVNTLDFKETRNISEFALNSRSQLMLASSTQQCLNSGICYYLSKKTEQHCILFSICFLNQLKSFSKMD